MKYSLAKEQGFVSIIVSAILMILLSLVTIGFSQLMQREQRQALDRQLSTQAFYAAETAVNDVYSNLDGLPEVKPDCDVSGWNDGIIDASTPEISYSCLKYNKVPADLVFTDTVNTSDSKIFPVESANVGSVVQSVTFNWNGPGGSTGVNSLNSGDCSLPFAFEAVGSYETSAIPVLRVDLIAAPVGGIDRAALVNGTSTFYLFPKSGCGVVSTVNAVGSDAGRAVAVDCVSGVGCELEITGLNADRYFARIKSIYNPVSTMTITATDSSPDSFRFKGAQTIVDATGKANDVLRRIEVRISDNLNYYWPEAVVETTEGLCKLITAAPNLVNESNCYN